MNRWEYEATPQDEAIATAVGFLRQAPYLGRPEANRNYSEGDIWESCQHEIACLAEIAFAAMLGIESFIPSYNTHKGEPDVGLWEVRYKFPDPKGLPASLRFTDKVDDPNVAYVLLTGGPSEKLRRSASNGYKTPAFKAEGWIWGKDAVSPEFEITTFLDKYRKFEVPIERLNSMDLIVSNEEERSESANK